MFRHKLKVPERAHEVEKARKPMNCGLKLRMKRHEMFPNNVAKSLLSIPEWTSSSHFSVLNYYSVKFETCVSESVQATGVIKQAPFLIDY